MHQHTLAVEFVTICSDSHEFIGDDNDASSQPGAAEDDAASETKDFTQDESMETETAATNGTKLTEESDNEGSQEMEVAADNAEEKGEKIEEQTKEKEEEQEEEYNPLIVRRSRRAIKPTKDVDLYLLGAQFGIDVDGLSDADSSDQEFAPAVESEREFSDLELTWESSC